MANHYILVRFFIGLILGVSASTAAAHSIPTIELLWTGKATHYYAMPAKPKQQKMLEALQKQRVGERMAAVAARFRLKHDLEIGIEACGRPNAQFDPHTRTISICLELLEFIGESGMADNELRSKFDDRHMQGWLMGVVWSIYLHELGHALIHINDIKITGREEDVADQFAVWYALRFVDLSKQPLITPSVWFWNDLAKKRNLSSLPDSILKIHLADEHSLDQQRAYNVACWALGADPVLGERTASFIGLPEARIPRCKQEYEQLHKGMYSLFSKYIRNSSR